MNVYSDLRTALRTDLSNCAFPVVTSDMDVATVRASSLSHSFLKKNVDEISDQADAACLSLFLEANSRCAVVPLGPQELFMDLVWHEVIRCFDKLFHYGPNLRFDSSDFDRGCGVGPGASLQASSDDFYSKLFAGVHSYTNSLLPLMYRRYISSDPKWQAAELLRSTRYGSSCVRGNRLSFVPKTTAISRSICTEPVLNMFFQKGVGSVLEQVLRSDFKIDLSTQPELNRRLARKGSIDGSFGTIDLKSASDSISHRLLRQILPGYILSRLEQCRSPYVQLPNGDVVELHMISSMGNGFTFPLQTLLFSVIVKSVYRTLGIPICYNYGKGDDKEPGNFGVFGDDIIVRKDAYDSVTRALKMFGFVVNDDKSFNVGLFRESCGGDYWAGSDVRGVYLKTLSCEADAYSIINRLVRWSCVSGIPLPNTISVLLRQCGRNAVPLHAGDTEGIKVPRRFLAKVKVDSNGALIYRALESAPVSFKVPMGEAEMCYYPTGKGVFFNPDGILASLVGGFITNGRISLRTIRKRRFKVRTRKTPCWDYPSADLKDRVDDLVVTYELWMHSLLESMSS